MKLKSKEQGFTLIELLLVVVIIGILLAVIVPRAWRANIDAKYGLLRQTASELGSFATQWAQQQSEAAEKGSGATDNAYFTSLLITGGVLSEDRVRWVARDDTNWHDVDDVTEVPGRIPAEPESTVNDIIPVGTNLSNPFNNADIFSPANWPGENTGTPSSADEVVPGALALARVEEDNRNYYAFVFLGEDSEDADEFHAGQGDADSIEDGGADGIAMLRNGIFMARTGTL